MPRNFSALILPHTIPQEDTLRQLLVYFETVFLYSPMESAPPALPPELATLCQRYAPAPLGEGLANFQQLIRDMTGNRAEYYGGGLSRISADTGSVDEESVWRLISRLNSQSTRRPQEETLLQARLLLSLAEARDREEEEIKEAMAGIERQAQTMLHGFTDEDEEEFPELQGIVRPDREPANDTLDRRLWAWAHLFLNDKRAAEHWLAATTPEVMAILADQAISHYGENLIRLFHLPLPEKATITALSPRGYLDTLTSWRDEAADCLVSLAASLKASAISGRSETSESIQEQLAACYSRTTAWGEKHQACLDLYLLPLSLSNLLAKIAKAPDHHPVEQPFPFGIVGVIHREADQSTSI
jgi:hypothetical protein